MNILNHNTTIFLIVCQLLNCSQDYFSIKSLKSLIRKKYLTNEVTSTFGSMHKASGELMLNLTISQNPSCLLFVNSRCCDIIHVQMNSKGSEIINKVFGEELQWERRKSHSENVSIHQFFLKWKKNIRQGQRDRE